LDLAQIVPGREAPLEGFDRSLLEEIRDATVARQVDERPSHAGDRYWP
jgi:hypothetical protein